MLGCGSGSGDAGWVRIERVPNLKGIRVITHQTVDLDRKTHLPIEVVTHTVDLRNLATLHKTGLSGVLAVDVVDVETFTYPAGGS